MEAEPWKTRMMLIMTKMMIVVTLYGEGNGGPVVEAREEDEP